MLERRDDNAAGAGNGAGSCQVQRVVLLEGSSIQLGSPGSTASAVGIAATVDELGWFVELGSLSQAPRKYPLGSNVAVGTASVQGLADGSWSFAFQNHALHGHWDVYLASSLSRPFALDWQHFVPVGTGDPENIDAVHVHTGDTEVVTFRQGGALRLVRMRSSVLLSESTLSVRMPNPRPLTVVAHAAGWSVLSSREVRFNLDHFDSAGQPVSSEEREVPLAALAASPAQLELLTSDGSRLTREQAPATRLVWSKISTTPLPESIAALALQLRANEPEFAWIATDGTHLGFGHAVKDQLVFQSAIELTEALPGSLRLASLGEQPVAFVVEATSVGQRLVAIAGCAR